MQQPAGSPTARPAIEGWTCPNSAWWKEGNDANAKANTNSNADAKANVNANGGNLEQLFNRIKAEGDELAKQNDFARARERYKAAATVLHLLPMQHQQQQQKLSVRFTANAKSNLAHMAERAAYCCLKLDEGTYVILSVRDRNRLVEYNSSASTIV